MFLEYLGQVYGMERQPEAREESFYGLLQRLLERFAKHRGREIGVTIIPRKTESCLLDLQVWGEARRIVGYIEAKLPGTDLAAASQRRGR